MKLKDGCNLIHIHVMLYKRGELSVTVIVIGNGICDLSSNPEQGC